MSTERDPYGQVRTEQRGHLLMIGIDRPEKRNGFTPTNIAGGFMAYEKAGGEVVREMAGVT